MSTKIRVPQMGESVTEGVIASWLKQEGESVATDEPVVEVETDKITVEVPSPAAGILRRQTVSAGDTVGVGDIIGEIEEGAGQSVATPSPVTPATTTPAASASNVPAPAVSNGRPHLRAMPAARAEADRSNVDLSAVKGTGRDGRVLKEDVLRTASASLQVRAPAPSDTSRETRKPMSPLRRRLAERLVESQNTAAILTTFNEIDMSGVIALRSRWKDRFVESHGVKLGFMSFFVKAAVDALKAFASVNAEIEGETVLYKHYYDIGVAVGSGKGLVVPVIRDADRLTMAEIEGRIGAFGEKARTNKLSLDDLTGGTFTISNGGVYGSMMSTPILNPPQTGILGLHNIVERPIAVAGKVVIRPIMYIALSYDHRLIDGREAVQFLVRIKTLLEEPERLFLGV